VLAAFKYKKIYSVYNPFIFEGDTLRYKYFEEVFRMKFIAAVVLVFYVAVGAFASGENQYKEIYPSEWGIEGFVEGVSELQVYTGTFRMEEGSYPAILTDDGELYYLMAPGMFSGSDMLSAEGAALSIEAFKAPFSSVHLMVVSAEVDGEEINLEWYDPRGYDPMGYGPWGYGHMGYGPRGYGHMGYGPRGYGPRGHGPRGYGHRGYGPWGHGHMGHGPWGYGLWGHDDHDH